MSASPASPTGTAYAATTITPIDAVHVLWDGKSFINFASNDYLGLARHPRVVEAAAKAIERYGFGSGAAPLITGYTDAHASAESAIAAWKGTEAAVLFSSGYQANMALVQTLAADRLAFTHAVQQDQHHNL